MKTDTEHATTAVAVRDNHTLAEYTPIRGDDQMVTLIKKTVAKDATDTELAFFINQCDRTRLDPISKQIYFTKYGGKVTIITAIDGFRVIASRSGHYAGQEGPFWCGTDGEWKDVWLSSEPPAAARVTVLRTIDGQLCRISAVAHWKEYQSPRGLWKTMPANQLAKCAEALALRKAFPNDLSGLYTSDEMDQADRGGGTAPSAAASADSSSAGGAAALAEKLSSDKTAEEEIVDAEYEEKPIEIPDLTAKNLIEVLRNQTATIASLEKNEDDREVQFNDDLIKSRISIYNQRNFKKEKWGDLSKDQKTQLMKAAVSGELAKAEADIPF